MDKPKRKLKGGAEKLRAKRLKNLAADAGKCAKITEMFSGGASGAPSTSGESSTTSTSGQGEGASCSDPPMETAQMVEEGDGPSHEQGGGDDESEPEGHGLSEPLPVHQILLRFNLVTDAYPLLSLSYKYLLTLSVTQVACERSFSTSKFIKSRLRSSLSAGKLEAFMLMSTEKDILMGLDTDSVIDRVAEKSELLRKLLLY